MKIWSIFRKTLLEQMRDPASLSMVLVLSPFFVLLYWIMSGGGSITYKILVINQDQPLAISQQNEGQQVIEALKKMHYPNGLAMAIVASAQDRPGAEQALKNRDAAALLILPADFSAALHQTTGPRDTSASKVTLVGDMANPAYTVASILALTATDQVIQSVTGQKPAVGWHEEFLSARKPRTGFEVYVPGLLVLSIIMLVFTTALPLVRERENRTLRRFRLSCATSFDLLTGVSLAQVIIGSVAVILTFYTAVALGFHSEGSLWAALMVSVLTVGSVIAVGIVTACFCKNATAVLTIGTLPFFLLMWFTGAAMPMPSPVLFTLAGHAIAFNDFLPPTHAVIAINKIVSFGASFREVLPEVSIMLFLTVVYYFIGVRVYKRFHLQER